MPSVVQSLCLWRNVVHSARRAIVTGATGFVGANLARRLLSDGHEVHLLVRPGYNPWRIKGIHDDVRIHQCSLIDFNQLKGTVGAIRADWIFHLAVHGAYSSQNDQWQMVETNIQGTVNLVEACVCAGFEAFVNTGSSSEYGFKDHAPAENECLEPNSYYAVTKAAATMYCRYTAYSRDVHLPTLRLYSVYGPYEEPTRLIPTLVVRGLEGQLPPLADPTIARDYVYVDDVSTAYLLAATVTPQEPGAVYNVGTGIQTTLREVVEVARQAMHIPVEPQWGTMPDRKWDTTVWVADNRKIRGELGWQPHYSFADGFQQTAEWLRSDASIQILYHTIS